MPRVAARVEEDPEAIAEREYAKMQAELNGFNHSGDAKMNGSGGKKAAGLANGNLKKVNGGDVPGHSDDNSDAKSVTSTKSSKSTKSVGRNSTKAEKKLRNRGISGSSCKKDGGRFDMGLENYEDYEALDDSFDEVEDYVAQNYSGYKEMYGDESDGSESVIGEENGQIKESVLSSLQQSVQRKDVPLLTLPDELAALFDETQRVNLIYEAIHHTYKSLSSPFISDHEAEKRCAQLFARIVKEGLLSESSLHNYCNNAHPVTQPIRLMNYVLEAMKKGEFNKLDTLEYPKELSDLASDLVEGRIEACDAADKLNHFNSPFYESQFVRDILVQASQTHNRVTIYNVLGSIADLVSHKIIDSASVRIGFLRYLEFCVAPGLPSMANLTASYALNEYNLIDDDIVHKIPEPDVFVAEIVDSGGLLKLIDAENGRRPTADTYFCETS